MQSVSQAFGPLSGRIGVRRGLTVAVVGLTLLMVAVQVAGFLYTQALQGALIDLRNDTREMRVLQQALVDEKEGIEDYLLTGDPAFLQRHAVASERLRGLRETAVRRLDARAAPRPGAVLRAHDDLDRLWGLVVRHDRAGDAEAARRLAAGGESQRLLGVLRAAIARYIEDRNARGERLEARIALGARAVLAAQVLGGALTLLGFAVALRSSVARGQVEALFEMADVLQSASDYDDAKAVLRATAARLLPGFAGALYVFNNSRDRLELLTAWNYPEGEAPEPVIPPGACWAAKRGRPHANSPAEDTVSCGHYGGGAVVLETPMTARGEIHGLLCFGARGAEAGRLLEASGGVIAALADAMSLALSNIALREKLKNQALRDPLTGLYNRRYMEDMLQRCVQIAQRNGTAVSVLMLDLDHFKKLNDEHGHMAGDTILRAVASTLTGSLRDEDVACRYGGEELTVLLPNCAIEDAARKAEALRVRIEQLSELHGARVSASFGVASIPETAGGAAELVAAADAALYQAKRAGRNRVGVASPTARAEEARRGPALAAAE